MDADSQQRADDPLLEIREGLLEKMYSTFERAKRLLVDAGYEEVYINVQTSDTRTMWGQLISQLETQGILDDVLLVVTRECGPTWKPKITDLVAERKKKVDDSRRADTVTALHEVDDIIGRLVSYGRSVRRPVNPSRGSLAALQQNIQAFFKVADSTRTSDGRPREDEYAWLDALEEHVIGIADSLQMYLRVLRACGPAVRPLPGASKDARSVSAVAEDESTLISAKAALRQRLLQLGDVRQPD